MGKNIVRAMACCILSGLLIGLASAAWATTTADGVTLLTQPTNACSGFPLKISKTGSYRLASNLAVGCVAKDAIDATAAGLVTIDLNGFSITGPGSGSGIGINASSATNLVVRNGSVAAMGTGINAPGECKVEQVFVLFNAGTGIICNDGLVLNNLVVNNGFGIDAGDFGNEAIIQGNKVDHNVGGGILDANGVVQDNTVDGNGFTGFTPNGGIGIEVFSAVVTGNRLQNNGGDGIRLAGGANKVSENVVTFSSEDGIHATPFDGFSVAGNKVIDNTAFENGGFGIRFPGSDFSSAFTDNVLFGNSDSPSCTGTLKCNSQVCNGTSTDAGTTNLCNSTLG